MSTKNSRKIQLLESDTVLDSLKHWLGTFVEQPITSLFIQQNMQLPLCALC